MALMQCTPYRDRAAGKHRGHFRHAGPCLFFSYVMEMLEDIIIRMYLENGNFVICISMMLTGFFKKGGEYGFLGMITPVCGGTLRYRA
jgi:hypothetical protein